MWSSGDKKSGALGSDENFTFLGKGVDFKGIVNFEGTVRIDGRLEGEIHTKGTLVVGELATIKGIISAGVLVCSGRINGTISQKPSTAYTRSCMLPFLATLPSGFTGHSNCLDGNA